MYRTFKLMSLLSALVVATSYYLYAQEDLPAGGGAQGASGGQEAATPAAEVTGPAVYSYAIGLEIGKNF
jgi:hypothetical protein